MQDWCPGIEAAPIAVWVIRGPLRAQIIPPPPQQTVPSPISRVAGGFSHPCPEEDSVATVRAERQLDIQKRRDSIFESPTRSFEDPRRAPVAPTSSSVGSPVRMHDPAH